MPDASSTPLERLTDLVSRALALADTCDLPDVAVRLEQARLSLVRSPQPAD